MGFVPKVSYRTWKVACESTATVPAFLTCHDFRGLLVSQSHYRKPNGSWSGGGPFLVLNRSLIHRQGENAKSFRANGTTITASWAGAVGFPSFTVPDTSRLRVDQIMTDARGFGLEGYNRTKPGHSEADVWVGVKELLQDGIPSIPGTTLIGNFKRFPQDLKDLVGFFKSLGSEHLNDVFGWRPLVNDIRRLYNLTKTVDKRLQQLVAQNGQRVRRRTILRSDSDSVQESTAFGSAYANAYGGAGIVNSANPPGSNKTSWSRVTTSFDHVWYSACYKYWIPDPGSLMWQARAKAALFGALPTPGALYAAMPWSWLADWFTNIGNIAEALSPTAVDNLVQLYGYTMRHKGTKVTCNASVSYPGKDSVTTVIIGGKPTELGYRWKGTDGSSSSVYTDEYKTRVTGFNPFGPDKSADALSGYQVGVLAALGLTRLG
jgi:pyruvate-formate lyase-activating enzyme